MREWKIICDKCGVEITGNPFAVMLERVGREENAPGNWRNIRAGSVRKLCR